MEKIQRPTEHQLLSVAGTIRENLLPRWNVKDITSGIERVRANELGIINEVFVSPGLFATLCYYQYGDRRRKPFRLNGFVVKQWRRPK